MPGAVTNLTSDSALSTLTGKFGNSSVNRAISGTLGTLITLPNSFNKLISSGFVTALGTPGTLTSAGNSARFTAAIATGISSRNPFNTSAGKFNSGTTANSGVAMPGAVTNLT